MGSWLQGDVWRYVPGLAKAKKLVEWLREHMQKNVKDVDRQWLDMSEEMQLIDAAFGKDSDFEDRDNRFKHVITRFYLDFRFDDHIFEDVSCGFLFSGFIQHNQRMKSLSDAYGHFVVRDGSLMSTYQRSSPIALLRTMLENRPQAPSPMLRTGCRDLQGRFNMLLKDLTRACQLKQLIMG